LAPAWWASWPNATLSAGLVLLMPTMTGRRPRLASTVPRTTRSFCSADSNGPSPVEPSTNNPVHAGLDLEIDERMDRLLVRLTLLVERGDQGGDDATQHGGRHG
jgi:hypothetical protein